MTRLQGVLLAVVAAPLAMLATATYVIVDVRDGEPEGHRIFAPVPLALAQLTLAFVPAEHKYIEVRDLAEYHPLAKALVEELKGLSDVELVRVEDGEQQVRIAKVGDDLKVEVFSPEQEVQVDVPLATLGEILSCYDGSRVEAGDLVAALRRFPGGRVHVLDSDTEVTVRIW